MSRQILSDLDFSGVARAINLPDPVLAQHAATKAYVDSAVEGLAWKDSCRVSTTANLNLAAPGPTIDGVTMAAGDRVLVTAQTAGTENGIYVWNGAAAAMTRALDANTAAELEQAIATVEEGTNAGASYRQTAVNFTLGLGAVAWTAFGTGATAAGTGTAGIAALATQAETDAGVVTNKIVTPATLAGWSGRVRKIVQTIGDGSATQFTVTHNLGVLSVQVEVYRNSGNADTVVCDVERTGANAVRLTFASAPAASQFVCVVIG
jgi:hypothetical protein